LCPRSLTARAVLAESWTANPAQILAAQPDLVIASVPYLDPTVREILKAGARFLGLALKNLADIYTDIATIAGAVGVGDRGEELIAAMQQSISDIRNRTAASARPRVWCEEWGKPLIALQTGSRNRWRPLAETS
jgi:iron complex transport system substrate-binding protein